MKQRLPVTIITGFLGAGKTTLLRYLLCHSHQRLAVMVNEFGTVGLDGDLIRSCGFCDEGELDSRVIELTNGCLCCTVQDEFLPSIELLLKRSEQIDGIVIETSGLALPGPLLQALNWPRVRTRVHVNGVVTVVDGEALCAGSPISNPVALEQQRREDPSLEHITAVNDLFNNQLQLADQVLISRADRITIEELDQVCCCLRSNVRPGTPILSMEQGKIDPLVVLGPQHSSLPERSLITLSSSSSNSYLQDHHDSHSHIAVVSSLVRYDGYVERSEIERLLPDLVCRHQVIRIKGHIWLKDKPLPLQLQMVGPRLNSWFEATSTQSWRPPSGSGVDLVMLGLQDSAMAELESILGNLFNTCQGATVLSLSGLD
ncbi:cobalamin biosynthesis protein CobW [cyanobiont of Ornithocercus magnificus]|nr:cobalamin biosynthesis protein CobW [cyanobiont of Ornithocercus magnificus]